MIDSSEREYRLPMSDIDGFVNWINHRVNTDTLSYTLSKIGSKEHLFFDKIISFEVMLLAESESSRLSLIRWTALFFFYINLVTKNFLKKHKIYRKPTMLKEGIQVEHSIEPVSGVPLSSRIF